jgi:hypothetical protein
VPPVQEEINLLNEADEPVATSANQPEPEQAPGQFETAIDNRLPGSTEPALSGNMDEDFLRNQIDNKDEQIEQLNQMIGRKDDQIEALLDRDLETNILIQGLQRMLSNTLGIEAPSEDRHSAIETRSAPDAQSSIFFQTGNEQSPAAGGEEEGDDRGSISNGV